MKVAIANNRLSGLILSKEVRAALKEALEKGNITTTDLLKHFIG